MGVVLKKFHHTGIAKRPMQDLSRGCSQGNAHRFRKNAHRFRKNAHCSRASAHRAERKTTFTFTHPLHKGIPAHPAPSGTVTHPSRHRAWPDATGGCEGWVTVISAIRGSPTRRNAPAQRIRGLCVKVKEKKNNDFLLKVLQWCCSFHIFFVTLASNSTT